MGTRLQLKSIGNCMSNDTYERPGLNLCKFEAKRDEIARLLHILEVNTKRNLPKQGRQLDLGHKYGMKT